LFSQTKAAPYERYDISASNAGALSDKLAAPLRRCYITDNLLQARVAANEELTELMVIASKLPDPGAVMAGDFGEVLGFLFHCSISPDGAIGIKKWRLKQDRTKAAPGSDVVHLVFDDPENGYSTDDYVLCSEVKTKSTGGSSTPIQSAIDDCEKDRTSRLAATLNWLKDRAISDGVDDVSIAQLDRFIKADAHPAYKKRFQAVAVICDSLIATEVRTAPAVKPTDYTLVVIGVPELHKTYNEVFAAARLAVP
jgi:hypothetical protein